MTRGVRMSSRKLATLLIAMAVVAAACGGSHGSSAPTPTTGGPATTAAPTVAKFGTLDSPGGPGTATGATAKGVTNTSITVGYGDDAGYAAAQGLDKEMSDA